MLNADIQTKVLQLIDLVADDERALILEKEKPFIAPVFGSRIPFLESHSRDVGGVATDPISGSCGFTLEHYYDPLTAGRQIPAFDQFITIFPNLYTKTDHIIITQP